MIGEILGHRLLTLHLLSSRLLLMGQHMPSVITASSWMAPLFGQLDMLYRWVRRRVQVACVNMDGDSS